MDNPSPSPSASPATIRFQVAADHTPLCPYYNKSQKCRRWELNRCEYVHVQEYDLDPHVPIQKIKPKKAKAVVKRPSMQNQNQNNTHAPQSDLASATSEVKEDEKSAIVTPKQSAGSNLRFVLSKTTPHELRYLSLLRRTLQQNGFSRAINTNEANIMIYWGSSRPDIGHQLAAKLHPECRILHFPSFAQVSQKHRMAMNVEGLRQQYANPNLFPFCPLSFILPVQQRELLEAHLKFGGSLDPTDIARWISIDEEMTSSKSFRITVDEIKDALQQDASLAEQYFQNHTIFTAPAKCITNSFVANEPRENPNPPLWICKPYHRGMGHGIQISNFHSLNADPQLLQEEVVAQMYIERPLLLQNSPYKFDLRIYVAVLSSHMPAFCEGALSAQYPNFPFAVYLFTDALVRFAACPYSDTFATSSWKFSHITNNSVANQYSNTTGRLSNISLRHLKQLICAEQRTQETAGAPLCDACYAKEYGCERNFRWQRIWKQIELMSVLILTSSSSFLQEGRNLEHKFAFELLGMDVLIDADDRIWLAEVNHMPDLTDRASPFYPALPVEQNVKSPLIADFFTLLAIPHPLSSPDSELPISLPMWKQHHVGDFKRLT